MKKLLYLVALVTLLPSCYNSDYVFESAMIDDNFQTLPPTYYDSDIMLEGDKGDLDYRYIYYQVGRTRDFSDRDKNIFNFDNNRLNKNILNGTYYYRLCAISGNDTVFASNVESFTVDHSISMYDAQKVDGSSAYLSFTSDVKSENAEFIISTDNEFKEYDVVRAYIRGVNDGKTEYSGAVEKLTPGMTYYAKASINMLLGSLESEINSFTTQGVLKMGEVTYTGWDGKTYPMTEGYDFFRANYMLNGEVIDRNIEVYYSSEGWKLSKEFIPNGNGVLFGYLSYDEISNDEIYIQTYKYDNPTLMWGVAEERNGVFNINLQNMLSRVVFHLTVDDDYPVDKPAVEGFTIAGKTLPSQANFQILNGQFVYNQWSFSEPLGYWNRIPLCKGETVDVVMYSIPCDNGNATATLKLEDRKWDSEIEIGWKSGNTYEYNLQVTATGLSISDVIVNQWQPTEGGSITINPNK